jgi:hypothetical protein
VIDLSVWIAADMDLNGDSSSFGADEAAQKEAFFAICYWDACRGCFSHQTINTSYSRKLLLASIGSLCFLFYPTKRLVNELHLLATVMEQP